MCDWVINPELTDTYDQRQEAMGKCSRVYPRQQ